jgi:RNA polymerase sigma-70 factor (ECF subfamily)
MDDNRIIDLYFTRDERAIEHTRAKYGKLLYHVSYKILHSNPDVEECVDDTYMKAWGAMPPERPNILSAFLCKITRNLSLNRYLQNKARGRMMTTEKVFEEIAECVPDTAGPISDDLALRDAINGFLESLGEMSRMIFVKRYFYMMSVNEISIDMKTSVSNVKVSLMRTRNKFKDCLEKAGISI